MTFLFFTAGQDQHERYQIKFVQVFTVTLSCQSESKRPGHGTLLQGGVKRRICDNCTTYSWFLEIILSRVFNIYVRFIPFFVFWSKWPKTKKSIVLFVYFLYKKSAFCLKITADFFIFWNKNEMNPTKESSLLPVIITELPTLVERQIKTNAFYPNRYH